MGRNLVGVCPKIILRGVQVYNKRRRATVPCAGGGEKYQLILRQIYKAKC